MGQCLLDDLTVALTVVERTCSEAYDLGFVSFGRALLPWLRINVNGALIRNFSFTHEDIADFLAKTLAPRKNLWTLTKVVLDNRVAFDYLLADHHV